MLETHPSATNRWKNSLGNFLRLRRFDASSAWATVSAYLFSKNEIIPRHVCRFEYIKRTSGLKRHQFQASCLLQARYSAPFLTSESIVIQDSDGAAIWWWDAAAGSTEGHTATKAKRTSLPESVCAQLPDGWHHIRLECGYEARHVQRGMVIHSTWKRTPFELSDWINLQGGNINDPQHGVAVPVVTDAPPLQEPFRPRGGRILSHVISTRDSVLITAAVFSAALGGWWHGKAEAINQSTAVAKAEADRLERFVSSYDLFARSRAQQAHIKVANDILGPSRAPTDLIATLSIVEKRNLQVSSAKIDSKTFEISIVPDANPDKLRSIAASIEAMPGIAQVVSRDADGASEIMLTADVGS